MDYDFKLDGMFLVRSKCQHCGEEFDTIAVAQYRQYCDACQQMLEWEEQHGKR